MLPRMADKESRARSMRLPMGWCDNSRKSTPWMCQQGVFKLKFWLLICLGWLCLATSAAQADEQKVLMQTSLGAVVFELNNRQAPISVANFLAYVNQDFYNGTLFHRVIPGFMIQGGGLTTSLLPKTAIYQPIPLESNNGLSNITGSIAMARTSNPDSATSEFFINIEANRFLDYATDSAGYAVFGEVVAGYELINTIGGVNTHTVNYMNAGAVVFQRNDVPITNIVIVDATQSVAGVALSSDGVFDLSDLQEDASWSYSLDGGNTWSVGAGTTLDLPEGNYDSNQVRVRQTGPDGQVNATDSIFTSTLFVDETPPTVTLFVPANGTNGVSPHIDIVVTFSEEITSGSGDIVLRTAAGTTVETYAAGSSNVTISGNKLVIDPTLTLDYQTQYVLTLPSGVVEDLAGNSLASVATHSFTTHAEGSGYDVAPTFKHWNKGAGAGSEKLLSNVKVEVGENIAYSDSTGASLLEGVDDLDDTDDGIITPVVTYPKVADKDDASINLSDVIASLKLFLGLNLPDAYRSPYNYVASDLDANGKVELSDVISLLKVFLGLPVANTQAMEWVFVKESESPTDINNHAFDKDHATPPPITHDFSESADVNIVGILRGDVDGSWTPPIAN